MDINITTPGTMEIQFITQNRNLLIDIMATSNMFISFAYELIRLKVHTSEDHRRMGIFARKPTVYRYGAHRYVNQLLELLISRLHNCTRVRDKTALFSALLDLAQHIDGKTFRPIESHFIIW